ncbi:RagB/SusD family nutrient uptake outer membrane protein [Myroides marinus]|uniref:RagB/SusD family nutrient uptake outer membrane protein n=1 Tax=Myroides marinus TaxID=703342 RepID=UPI0025783A8B|nr:RagB/SusD family nutrient uptake outer membrane protein [Myroides marinus]MDM1346188.1 RagB/SusD family nutrient uptake outer membrane protein [Myroides marinus]MDM1349552.1 RagB/SusD family nutrient uptake outer membrane protein [Myroides marinus]MDM1356129.1 RagB/SusD family nutrient uptake outer membrane protein [Myroides marinus]MDM1356762.1 RagB/SusD family nutrient uptake outer membrane protein [Myroides marinus]MDM1361109.1 RagB/SusD family nutrient uptake outer membrane protein [Myr
MRKILYSSFVLGAILLASCSKDFTENDLNSKFSDEQMAALAAFPESALILNNGLENGGLNIMFKSGVAEVGQHEDFGQKAVDIAVDAMSNDVAYANMNWFSYQYNYTDRLESNNTATIYNYYNKLAHNANQVIQSLVRTNGADYKSSEMYGRVLALRAFANLNLIRLYEYNGDGISLETVNEKGEFVYQYNRVKASEVNKFIEEDLTTAYKLLEKYNRPNINFIDKTVVAGLLSRFYLYTEKFDLAKEYSAKALKGELQANSYAVVNNGNFSAITNADWMWASDINGSNTGTYASYFSHMDAFNVGYGKVGNTTKSIDRRLYDEMNATDVRKVEWFADGVKVYTSPKWGKDEDGKPVTKVIPRYVNTKFVDPTMFLGDYCYMRKTEMVFNYIEASIKLGDESGAKTMLAQYMSSRDKSYDINTRLSKHKLFEEFQIQKRIELWGEGFGLLDMKRWNVSLHRKYEGTNHIVNGQINIDVPSAQFTLQFPQDERNANPLLAPQNPIK